MADEYLYNFSSLGSGLIKYASYNNIEEFIISKIFVPNSFKY